MTVELVPDPGCGDPTARAALAALSRHGLVGEAYPSGVSDAWQRAGRVEALRNGVGPARPPVRASVPPRRQGDGRS